MSFKYFKDSEIKGLDENFVMKLDQARAVSGIPYVLTSTVRTEAENTAAGGVHNSLHMKGLAVDIRCNTSANRFKIVFGLLTAGFKDIGIYKGHVHVEIDKDSTEPVLFLG